MKKRGSLINLTRAPIAVFSILRQRNRTCRSSQLWRTGTWAMARFDKAVGHHPQTISVSQQGTPSVSGSGEKKSPGLHSVLSVCTSAYEGVHAGDRASIQTEKITSVKKKRRRKNWVLFKDFRYVLTEKCVNAIYYANRLQLAFLSYDLNV